MRRLIVPSVKRGLRTTTMFVASLGMGALIGGWEGSILRMMVTSAVGIGSLVGLVGFASALELWAARMKEQWEDAPVEERAHRWNAHLDRLSGPLRRVVPLTLVPAAIASAGTALLLWTGEEASRVSPLLGACVTGAAVVALQICLLAAFRKPLLARLKRT